MSNTKKRIYDYIVDYISINNYSPTIREICKGVNLKSTATVHNHLLSLVDMNMIRMEQNKVRSIEIIHPHVGDKLD